MRDWIFLNPTEGTWTWDSRIPGDILAAIFDEQPHLAPSIILDPRHSQTDPFSLKLSFIASAFPKKSFIRSSRPAPINCIFLLAKKQATLRSVSQCVILNQLQKVVVKILQIYSGKNEIKLWRGFLSLPEYKITVQLHPSHPALRKRTLWTVSFSAFLSRAILQDSPTTTATICFRRTWAST